MTPVKVKGPDGKIYEMPEGTTKEKAIAYFKSKGIGAAAQPKSTPGKPEGMLSKVGRGAAIGAFEGLGIKPSTDPLEVITGTASQFGEGIKSLVGDTWKANRMAGVAGPNARAAATAIDLVPTMLDRIATGLETTGKEAYQAGKGKDWEQMSEKLASMMTQIAMLKGGKEAATGKLADSEVVAGAKAASEKASEALSEGRAAKGTQLMKKTLTGVKPDFAEHLDRAVSRGYLTKIEKEVHPATVREASKAVLDYADKLQEQVVKPAVARFPNEAISGDALAKAVTDLKTPALERYFPEQVKIMEHEATRWKGKPMPLPQALDTLQRLNAMTRRLSEAAGEDAAAAGKVNAGLKSLESARDALRTQLYTKLEQLGVPNIADFQKDYGALREVGERLRQNAPRAEKIGKGESLGKSLLHHESPWMVLGGLGVGSEYSPLAGAGIAAIPFLRWAARRRGVPNAMIDRAFGKYGKAAIETPAGAP